MSQKAYEIAFKLGASVNSSVRTAFSNVNKGLSDTNKKSGGLGKTLGGLGVAFGAAAAAVGTLMVGLGEAVKQFGEFDSAMRQIEASTNPAITDMKEIKEISTNLYNKNLGEDWNDLANAIATTQSITALSGKELESATANAIAYRDTFGEDVSQSIKAADTMMRNFGISSDEAFNLLAQGAQNGLNKSDELLDSANEYAPYFNALGFSANEMFDTFSAGLESGAFNLDKVGDAVKEFNIRAKDGSKASVQAFEDLGMNADKMMQTFASGGPEAQKAFQQVIQAISAVEDPVKKNEIGVALMGTMFEDLEADVVAAMGVARNQFDMTEDTMERIKEIKYDGFGMALQGIGRQIQTGLLIPLGEKLLPYLNKFANWISDNMPAIQQKFQVFGSNASGVFEKIMTVVGPVMDFVRDKVMEVVSIIVQWWKTNGTKLLANVQLIFQGILKVVQFIMPVVRFIIEMIWGNIVGIIKGALKIITGLVKVFAGIFTGDLSKMWEGAKELFFGAIQFIWNLINLMFIGRIIKGVAGFVKLVGTTLKNGWTGMINGIKSFVDDTVKWFGKMKDEIGKKFDEIVTAAKELPGKIGQGIKDFAKDAWQGITDLASGLVDKFKEALGIKSPSKVFFDMAKWIVKGLVGGLNAENLKELGKSVFKDFAGGAFKTIGAIKDFFTGEGSVANYTPSAGVEQWRALAATALRMEGVYSEANLNRMLMQMGTESGGNPRAINLWDSNAKRGIPSKGLMQVIDPTFKAYARPGFDKDNYDPLSNMLASIRYSKSRYGSLERAWQGRGYAKGGTVNRTQWAWVGERGPELMKLPGGAHVNNNKKTNTLLSRVLSYGQSDSSGASQNEQIIHVEYSPKYIIQGNADQETIERMNIKSYHDFKRWMKQYEQERKRLSFN